MASTSSIARASTLESWVACGVGQVDDDEPDRLTSTRRSRGTLSSRRRRVYASRHRLAGSLARLIGFRLPDVQPPAPARLARKTSCSRSRTERADARPQEARTRGARRVRLSKRAARPNELSGGERQRGALAVAPLVVRPSLLLRRPTENLDLARRREILDSLYSSHRGRDASSWSRTTRPSRGARSALVRKRRPEVADEVLSRSPLRPRPGASTACAAPGAFSRVGR